MQLERVGPIAVHDARRQGVWHIGNTNSIIWAPLRRIQACWTGVFTNVNFVIMNLDAAIFKLRAGLGMLT